MSGPGSIQIKGSWPLETPEMDQNKGFRVQGVRAPMGLSYGPILWSLFGFSRLDHVHYIYE